MVKTGVRILYNILFTVCFALSSPYYFVRMRRRGNWQKGFAERFGRYDTKLKQAITNRHVLWMHAVSVGEVNVCTQLIRALGEADEGEHLIGLLTDDTAYGWARCLARGATTTWESWTSDVDGGSQSHGWGAAGLVAHVRYILGVQPLKPQYERVRIKPLSFGSRLPAASGVVPTDRGDLAVEWDRSADRFRLRVTLPVNVTARISVPKGNADDKIVRVDGREATGIEEGRYLSVDGIGSGSHEVIRVFMPARQP